MPLEPKIPKKPRAFSTKKCAKCEGVFGVDSFSPTHSIFYPDGYLPICNDCILSWLEEEKFNWAAVDKLCQWAGIPFIVKEWSDYQLKIPPKPYSPFMRRSSSRKTMSRLGGMIIISNIRN